MKVDVRVGKKEVWMAGSWVDTRAFCRCRDRRGC